MNFLKPFKKLLNEVDNVFLFILVVLIGLGIAFGILCLIWWCEQWLWNAALASYFGWQPISFWQMAGISILFGWLFKPTNTNNNKE